VNDNEALSRAANADAILTHPLIAEALQHFEDEVTKAWKNSSPSDAEGHQRLRNLLEAHRQFSQYLHQTITTGRLIKALPTRLDRAKKVIGLR
jgi:hypothetical protein